MATGVNPITLLDAGPIMANAMGLRWTEDRAEVVEYLNKYRQLLYTLYKKFHLFDDVFHVIRIETFIQQGSCERYRGFTLPNDVLGVEAVFKHGAPLTLHSRWRESHTGLGIDTQTSRIAALMMAEQFCTERDMTGDFRLKVFTEHENDNGKLMVVECLGTNGRPVKLSFRLIADGMAISRVKVRKVLSVSLPACRTGAVRLMQGDGFELSAYAPHESVPQYRRMKVPETCCDHVVLVQGNKRFQKIYFDHDIVEVGNQLIIESAGRYFKYGENTTEKKEIDRANYDLTQLATLLSGEMARHEGGANQDGFPFHRRSKVKSKTLLGYQR